MRIETCTSGRSLYLACALATALFALASVKAGAAEVTQAMSANTTNQESAAQKTAQFARGASEWQHSCGSCHNLRSASELTNAEWEVAMGQMRVRANLTGAQERDILAFLKASNTRSASSPSVVQTGTQPASAGEPSTGATKDIVAAGAAIYKQTCIACHGADGKGAIPGTTSFASAKGPLSQTDAVLESSIRNGKQTPGAPIAMPPKGGNANLTDADIHNVLLYLRDTFGAKKQ